MANWIVGVDVGGTFTDFAARDMTTGEAHAHKRPSTPDDPSRAILHGLRELLSKAGLDGAAVERFAHGTTVATNALLQRKGAVVAMATTSGFRDLVEIGRQVRPLVYDLQADAPPPLAERRRRFEVAERVGADGAVVKDLTDDEIGRLTAAIRAQPDIESVGVCFLFSFLNPTHERRVAEAIAAAAPDVYVSASSDVQPEFREYERFSTTLINAFLQPEVSRYMRRLESAIGAAAPNAKLGIFQSSGGLMSLDQASRFPVRTALSGPAAGVVGAAASGAASGVRDVVTLDMGGTSTDVCLIRDGDAAVANTRDIAGFRIRMPMVDIHTVGAGGGSIAYVGPDGLLKVGPVSAGAEPGPACYGKGGIEPTVSDANAILGRLPDSLAGGGLTIDRALAEQAVGRLASALGVSPTKAALGVVGVVNANMARAIRAVSTERGVDPRGLTLMPFGGAGGLHAVEVAASLGMRRILVPRAPGILCAEGLIEADLQENFVLTRRTPLDDGLDGVAEAAATLLGRADRWIADEAANAQRAEKRMALDMRFVGQNYELPVEIDLDADGAPALDAAAVAERFFKDHEIAYGHADRAAPVEVVNVRVRATASLSRAAARFASTADRPIKASTQTMWFRTDAPVDVPIYDRSALPVGGELRGPALITQLDSTTIAPPGTRLRVDEAHNLQLEIDDG